MNVGDHTTAGNGSLDQGVELLVASDGELEVSRSNSFHLKVLRGVAGKLKNLSSEVLEDSGSVDGRSGSNSAVSVNSALQESMNSSNGELYEERCYLAHLDFKISIHKAPRPHPKALREPFETETTRSDRVLGQARD